jgi:hypothetical protein
MDTWGLSLEHGAFGTYGFDREAYDAISTIICCLLQQLIASILLTQTKRVERMNQMPGDGKHNTDSTGVVLAVPLHCLRRIILYLSCPAGQSNEPNASLHSFKSGGEERGWHDIAVVVVFTDKLVMS